MTEELKQKIVAELKSLITYRAQLGIIYMQSGDSSMMLENTGKYLEIEDLIVELEEV